MSIEEAKIVDDAIQKELEDIKLHLSHVKKVLKGNTSNLKGFISSIKKRISVEKHYISALTKALLKSPEHKFYGNEHNTALSSTQDSYNASLEEAIKIRKEFIETLKNKKALLEKFIKEYLETQKKIVERDIKNINRDYTDCFKDAIKWHNKYMNGREKKFALESEPENTEDDTTCCYSSKTKSSKLRSIGTDLDYIKGGYISSLKKLNSSRKTHPEEIKKAMEHVGKCLTFTSNLTEVIIFEIAQVDSGFLDRQAKSQNKFVELVYANITPMIDAVEATLAQYDQPTYFENLRDKLVKLKKDYDKQDLQAFEGECKKIIVLMEPKTWVFADLVKNDLVKVIPE